MIEAKSISILVVDDEVELLDSITSLFSIFGFKVDGATNGAEAWEKIQKNDFQIVISDIKMPKMSGLELVEKIRERNYSFPKVLMISGQTEVDISDIYAIGANGFFKKPFDATAVRNSLTQTLLSPAEKWLKKKRVSSVDRFQRNFKNPIESAKYNEFSLGQTGFFLQIKHEKPVEGDFIDFDIKFKDDKPLRFFKGTGRVIWVRDQPEQDKPDGIGVQLYSLDEDCLQEYLDWLEIYKPKASIPKC